MGPEILASDEERERVVTMLREQVGTGRLTLAEFSERAATTYQSRTVGDLDVVARDLPRPVPATPPRRVLARPGLILTLAVLTLALVLGLTWQVLAGPTAPDLMTHTMNHMMGGQMVGGG